MVADDLQLKANLKSGGSTPLPSDVLGRVNAMGLWDMEDAKERGLLRYPQTWRDAAEVELKRFLVLVMFSREDPDVLQIPHGCDLTRLAPSPTVDRLWHAFFADTESYAEPSVPRPMITHPCERN